MRVVITGIGAVTPLGLDVPSTWRALLAGESGVARIQHFDTSEFSTRISASVKSFDIGVVLEQKEARKLDPFIHYAVVAAEEAMKDSGLTLEGQPNLAERCAVVVGSGIGGLSNIAQSHQVLLEKGPKRISPFFIPGVITNMVPGFLAMRHGFKGANLSMVSACTTGAHNIGQACRLIQQGEADVVMAGGTEMATTPLGLSGFSALRALSKQNDNPTAASRPWDKSRDGFVLGDGAGILMLESLEHAQARGARIYAELTGFGMSGDAYHMTSPDPSGDGFKRSMLNAINDAHISSDRIDYVNAHGTSTQMGDVIETLAIKNTFQAHAKQLMVSSTKSMTGHLLGAAGAIEAIFSILALRDQIVPPTINLDEPDEGCDLDYVPNQSRKSELNTVLSNSFGFGGTNASLVFERWCS